MVGIPTVGAILGCAHCEFKADWGLGNRPWIEVFEHVKTEHPEKWDDEDEQLYSEWRAQHG